MPRYVASVECISHRAVAIGLGIEFHERLGHNLWLVECPWTLHRFADVMIKVGPLKIHYKPGLDPATLRPIEEMKDESHLRDAPLR